MAAGPIVEVQAPGNLWRSPNWLFVDAVIAIALFCHKLKEAFWCIIGRGGR